MLSELSASSEMIVWCVGNETRSVPLVNTQQDQTLCLATKLIDLLFEYIFFLLKFICILVCICQHLIVASKASYVGKA